MIWPFWPLFLQSLGANPFWIGLIETMNNIAGFIFMYLVVGKIKHSSSVSVGLVISSVCFFALTRGNVFWHIVPIYVFLGVSWAFLYVGGLRYLMDKNVEKATVNGLLDSVISLSAIVGPFLGTLAISFGGYAPTMYAASALSLISFGLFFFAKKES